MTRSGWLRLARTMAVGAAVLVGAALVAPAAAQAQPGAHPHLANERPDIPTQLGISPCYQQCASPALTSSASPALRATVTDPDGGNLALVTFEVWNADRSSQLATSDPAVSNIKSGTVASWTPTLPDVDSATYQWRVRACDTEDCGAWSSWFTVTTDTVNPADPTISSTDYPEMVTGSEVWSGGPDVPGVFHFGVNGSSDVTEFLWSLDSSPPGTKLPVATDADTPLTITPGTDGLHAVFVQSVDAAGNESNILEYRFGVKMPPPGGGVWSFDDESGATATDSSGLGDDLTLNGGATRTTGHVGTGAVQLDGSTGYLASSTTLLDTTESFSVAGWINLTDTTRDQVLISQDGDQSSAFTLGYKANCGCWSFGVTETTGATVEATSTSAAVSGQWTHLVGEYDAATAQLSIYVNAVLQPIVDTGAPVASTGPLTVGRALTAGQPGSYLGGSIDEVGAYQRKLADTEIFRLAHAADL